VAGDRGGSGGLPHRGWRGSRVVVRIGIRSAGSGRPSAGTDRPPRRRRFILVDRIRRRQPGNQRVDPISPVLVGRIPLRTASSRRRGHGGTMPVVEPTARRPASIVRDLPAIWSEIDGSTQEESLPRARHGGNSRRHARGSAGERGATRQPRHAGHGDERHPDPLIASTCSHGRPVRGSGPPGHLRTSTSGGLLVVRPGVLDAGLFEHLGILLHLCVSRRLLPIDLGQAELDEQREMIGSGRPDPADRRDAAAG